VSVYAERLNFELLFFDRITGCAGSKNYPLNYGMGSLPCRGQFCMQQALYPV
jgi:hypothetical protein